ncbi:hypothetical protein Agub_g15381, partial [Astrephomene gubernaculifera]
AAERCEVLAGDCRGALPRFAGLADRVLLGLLPSSRGGWEAAVRALKPDRGGWLHLHHNVTDREEAGWLADTMRELRRLAGQAGRAWSVRLHHVERVKWYAPHIRHIVMDIECRPLGDGQQQQEGEEEGRGATTVATAEAAASTTSASAPTSAAGAAAAAPTGTSLAAPASRPPSVPAVAAPAAAEAGDAGAGAASSSSGSSSGSGSGSGGREQPPWY